MARRIRSEPIGEQFIALDENVEIENKRTIRCIYPTIADPADFDIVFHEERNRPTGQNLVRVLDAGFQDNVPYVAYEYNEGTDLERLLELSLSKKEVMPWGIAVYIGMEMLRGLDQLHKMHDEQGEQIPMTHGDVRPENTLIAVDGTVKLTNFCACLYEIFDESLIDELRMIRGHYCPPGGVDETSMGIHTDLWGVATTLWSALSLPKTSTETIDLVDSIDAEVPDALVSFFERARNSDVKKRFQDADSMCAELEKAIQTYDGYPPDELKELVSELAEQDLKDERQVIEIMAPKPPVITLNGRSLLPGLRELGPGFVLDKKYQIVSTLGQGGMARVFEAKHLGLAQQKAVKVLHDSISTDEIGIKRFLAEAEITASLKHENIVNVSDTGVSPEGHRYIVMDVLNGEPLEQWIESTKLEDKDSTYIEKLVPIMIDVCSGLEAAHEKNIIHRDLKPSNVFLHVSKSGDIVPKILDFGIAKRTDTDATKMTRTGSILGTMEYLSPEQLLDQSSDQRSDVYSLGIIIYEALTNTTPFRADYAGVVVTRITEKHRRFKEPMEMNPNAPPALNRIILKALNRYPDKRYQSVREFSKELGSLSRSTDGSLSMTDPQKGKKLLALGAMVLLCAFIMRGIVLFTNEEQKDAPAQGVAAVAPERPQPKKEQVILAPDKTDPRPEVVPKTSKQRKAATRDENGPRKIERPRESATKDEAKPAANPDPPNEKKAAEDTDKARLKELIAVGNRALSGDDLKTARDAFEDALIIDPRASRAWYGLGKVAFEERKYKEAVKKIEKAVKLNPKRNMWRNRLGQALLYSGDREQALDQWRSVLKKSPENTEAKRFLERAGEKIE
ncbi:MAG: protein kinase [Proteobacteria bacterium]|nr:protein kinase [Pseudomonadota bacterium]